VNYDIWFLFEQFRSLSIGGKIAMVSGHVLVILLIVLWETSRAQRHNAKRLSATTIEPTEKLIHTIGTSPQKGNLCNAHKGLTYLLETFRNSLSKYHLYYQSDKDGNSPTYPVQRHMRAIVNKLRRRVNQSGKEPAKESY